MKKILAVLMAMLVLFSTCAISAFATEAELEETVTEAADDATDLVYPNSFTQLKLSVVFKVFEKFFSFIINLFGDYAPTLDGDLADLVAGIFGTEETTAAAVLA